MDNIMKVVKRATIYFVVICLLIWIFFPDQRGVAAGLIVGSCVSAMNALILRRKIDFLAQVATGSMLDNGKKKIRLGIGLGSRIAMVLLAVMIAYRYPDHFNLVATLMACFYVQLFVLVSALLSSIRSNTK